MDAVYQTVEVPVKGIELEVDKGQGSVRFPSHRPDARKAGVGPGRDGVYGETSGGYRWLAI